MRHGTVQPDFEDILKRIPPRSEPYLPPDWLRSEMIERYQILSWLGIKPGIRVLEVGCGAHAITTVPLSFLVGIDGKVVAVEIERWRYFQQVVSDSGLKTRTNPLCCDAKQLPIRSKCFDIALIVHGIRSLRNEETMIRVISEMMRVASTIFLAESLPIARTEAQAAHLQMYNLREEIFEAVLGSKDDIHYLDLSSLKMVVEAAGGKVIRSSVMDVNLPHYLAFIPREYVEKIQDPIRRASLLARWDIANRQIEKYGEDHPPVGLVVAESRLG